MNNIFKIFENDLKKISRNIVVFIVVIGISILPALYAWFNIAANWDPYSSTSGIQFAVASEDVGYTFKSIKINAGDEIISNLKKNDKMGWTFVDKDEALSGVKNGKYYASIVIPKNFSENLCSITTGKFDQSQIEYYVNDKKNAIAPKITDKGVSAIESQVDSTFVSTITTVIATTLNITTDQLSSNKKETADKIISSLNDIDTEITTFQSSIDVFLSTLDTIKNLIKTNKDVLPQVSETLSKSGVITSSVKDSIDSSRLASEQLTNTISDIISSTDSMEDNINSQVTDAFNNVQKDSAGAAEKLVSTTALNNKIITINNTIIGILQRMGDTFGIDNSAMINKLKNANTKQQDLIDKINAASKTITQTGSLPKKTQQEILTLIASSKADISSLGSSFSGIKTNINKTVDKVYNALESASGLLSTINGKIPELDKSIDSSLTSIDQMKTTFKSVKTLMNNSKKKVDELISKVKDLKKNNTIENFISTIIERPDALGKFVADPVTVDTNEIYPVKNYGSGMTPFYTSLGFWVGGVILVAVMEVDLSKKDLKNLVRPTQTQQFFGRYLLFFFIGQIQSLIIALGDIFFLKVQCNDVWLFIVASLVSGFVYTLIIYSLTITFSVIGKALAVIFLVIQIAGSGGTFPVEVLPGPFQTISPYLPFKYGINALREAVAGPCITDFWLDLLYLIAFVPFALVLGLLLRKPCIKLMRFFNKRVEESDIIL